MAQTTSLDTLIELARKARDRAGQALAEGRQQSQQAEAQLARLHAYREEYAAQLQNLMTRGIEASTLANYRHFLGSLDEAIQSARQALDQQQQRVETTRQHWQQEQRQLTSFDTLAQRRACAVQRREIRQEQRLGDEICNQLVARNRRAMQAEQE